MKIVVLSRSSALYSTRRLVLVCRARGHEVRVIDPLRCSIVLDGDAPRLYARGEPLGPVDAVIPRIGRSITFYGLTVLRHFEADAGFCLNGSQAVARARDKLHTLQLLARHGVPAVRTACARHRLDVRQAIAALGGPPVVIKVTDGSQGLGVMLSESAAGAESIVDAFHDADRNILLQQFVPAAADLRLIVVGRRVVAAMRRIARNGDFRANIHRGAQAVAHHPSDAERQTAIDAARTLGLETAGVDLLTTPDGPLVLEVNASPGLTGIERASGRNVAGAIIAHVEKRAVRHAVPT